MDKPRRRLAQSQLQAGLAQAAPIIFAEAFCWSGISEMVSNAAFLQPSPYVVIRDFLGHKSNQQVIDYALKNQSSFEPSMVFKKGKSDVVDKSFRVSESMEPDAQFKELLTNAIAENISEITQDLEQPKFVPSDYEVEIAAHNDGAFFGTHIDTATGKNRKLGTVRIISAVYYFFEEPARFSGGEFRLRSIAPVERDGSFIDFAPENDMLLAFPSYLPHEVLPVSCPSRDFADSRFAVNCWLLR